MNTFVSGNNTCNIRNIVLSLVMLVFLTQRSEAQVNSYDVLIRNGKIVDGTGSPWFIADVAITDGEIVAIGKLTGATARQTIDATGKIVAPGFIDMMGQTAAPFLKDPNLAFNLLSQGITTINAGEGESDAPLNEADGKQSGWQTMRQFLSKLDAAGMPINMVQTVGHTQLRSIVIGDKDRAATAPEMERMRGMVREAMEAGAIGVSTSLIYPPAIYGSEQEITELTKVAGQYGGRYFTHMRNEGDRLLEAIDEALRIGAAAGTPVHIFHLKTAGQGNWGKMDLALARVKAARAEGQEVGVDVYPYINNGLGIRALLHPKYAADGQEALLAKLKDPNVKAEMRKDMESLSGWENWYAHAGKDWNKIIVANLGNTGYSQYNGKSIGAIATATGKSPWDVFFDLCLHNIFAGPQSMSEANKIKAMREEFTSFDTDAGPTRAEDAAHPRAFGAFPRVLSRYVKDLGVLTLEGAIHRMTSVAANEVMAYDRGRLSPGTAADIVIFDYNKIHDNATFESPSAASTGMEWVLVNGAVVFADGKYTGAKPGRVIRGPGYKK
ncbi:MAG TPA: D-aminoacylase [Cyclobacteriaceae bacterium]|nr:D-aminoacylase [Cyclobacteriaceae bacterium]